MKLLLKSLLAAGVFLSAYYLWLLVLPGAVAVPQSISQDNTIKLQNYLYANQRDFPTVILGSSLAAKLRPQVLPPGVCNLALRGQSVFEGFELLRRTGHVPRLILLEINVLDRQPNSGTIEELFSPALYPLRRWYPGLQARHQPLNEVLSGGLAALAWLRPAAAQRIQEKLGVSTAATQATPPADAPGYQPPSAAVVAANRAEYGKLPAQPGFTQNMALLEKYLAYFTTHGSQVVFFEMPFDAQACQGVRMAYIRQQLATTSPSSRLRCLPRPDCSAYRTTDGMHLTDPSAWRYSVVLARQLSALRATPEPVVARGLASRPRR